MKTKGNGWTKKPKLRRISSAAPSTTRTTLRVYFRPVFFPEICSKIRWKENRRDGKKYSILRFSVLRNIKENQGDEIPSFCRNFECRTFDLSDNSPYTSSVILAPEECKKNTQERYEIVKSEPTQSPVRWTFSAGETAGASKNITLITLQLIQHQLILLYHTLTPFATLFPDRLAVLQAGRKKMETPLAFSAGMCYDGFDCTEKARTITCWIFSIFWAR